MKPLDVTNTGLLVIFPKSLKKSAIIACACLHREVMGSPVRTAPVGPHFTEINVLLPPSNNKLKINLLKFKAPSIWLFFFISNREETRDAELLSCVNQRVGKYVDLIKCKTKQSSGR